MPAPLHYFEFHHRDYLASSTVSEMELVAEAIYLKLLMFQWEDESILNAPERLARRVRATPEEWAKFEPFLDEVFPLCEDGLRRNPRMDADRKATIEKCEKNKANGSKGGRKSKPSVKPPQSERLANGNPEETERKANAKRTVTERQAKPESESELTTNVVTPVVPKGTETVRLPELEIVVAEVDHWAEFVAAYPKRSGDLGKKKAEVTFRALAKRIDPVRIIEGVRRYHAWCTATGKVGTETVKQMTSFLNQEAWNEEFELPTTIIEVRARDKPQGLGSQREGAHRLIEQMEAAGGDL